MCAQETKKVTDLPNATTVANSDILYVIKSLTSYQMAKSVLFGPTDDSLAMIRDSLDSYNDRFGSGGSSDSSWTSITVDTITEKSSGHGVKIETVDIEDGNVNLPTGGAFLFNGAANGLYQSSPGVTNFFNNSATSLILYETSIRPQVDFYPSVTNSINLGGPSNYFNKAYLDTIYIENINTNITRDGSGNMVFVDGVTTAKTLAELAAGGYTFTNGLTESGGTVGIGDTIDALTSLVVDDATNFSIKSYYTSGTSSGLMRVYNGGFDVISYPTVDYSGTEAAFLQVWPTRAVLGFDNSTGVHKRLWIDENAAIFYDTDNSQGIEYGSNDYVPTDSTLVTKKYVDSVSSILTFRTSTASDTIDLTDNVVLMNVGSANNLTVVANSIKAFEIGTQITVVSIGAGQTTIVAGAGVTINSAGSALDLRVQYSSATLIKTATDVWLLIGDIST